MSYRDNDHFGSLSHDQYFQENFSNPAAAAGLVRLAASPDVIAALDLDHMVPLSVAQFDPDVGTRIPDLLFECPSIGAKVVVSILFEHKSRPDYRIALQFLRYILLVHERHLKESCGEPMMVLPILVYHGLVDWKPNFALVLSKHVPEPLQKYILQVPGIVLNLSKINDSEIETMTGLDPMSVAALMAIQNVFGHETGNSAFIQKLARKIRGISQDNRMLFIERTVLYLYHTGGYKKEEAFDLLAAFEDEDDFMKKFKTGRQLDMEEAEAKGRAEGISQGISQGENRKALETVASLLAEKCCWDFITRVTGVKEEEWKGLQ